MRAARDNLAAMTRKLLIGLIFGRNSKLLSDEWTLSGAEKIMAKALAGLTLGLVPLKDNPQSALEHRHPKALGEERAEEMVGTAVCPRVSAHLGLPPVPRSSLMGGSDDEIPSCPLCLDRQHRAAGVAGPGRGSRDRFRFDRQ